MRERLRLRAVLPLLAIVAAVVVLKLPALGVPAYWDEMGWVRQAHWLYERNLLRAIPGLRPPDAFWGHPPGLHVTLAALWKLGGDSLALAHLLIAGFAALGVAFTYLLGRLLRDAKTGLLAASLLFLSPVYFAQAGMFLADLPVAALGVASVYFALRDREVPYLITASYMVLIKETAIALVAALCLYLFLTRGRSRSEPARAVRYAAPLLVILLFFALQKLATGKFFFIYGFEFEPLVQLTARVVALRLREITEWIFIAQGRWLLTAAIALASMLSPAFRRRRELALFLLVVLLSGYSFAGLYYLPRYVLPVLPFFYLAGAVALMDLIPARLPQTIAAVAVLVLMVVWLRTQPFVGNAEFNPRYVDAVRLQQRMMQHVQHEHPDALVVTIWPHGQQLRWPYLGYVDRAVRVAEPTDDALRTADLVLISGPPQTGMERLRAHVRESSWRPVKRFTRAGMSIELFGRHVDGAGKE